MTSPTHDKEWKLITTSDSEVLIFRALNTFNQKISKDLYDQIRRDAVGKVREQIKERILSHATHRHMHSGQGNDWTCLDEVYASIMADARLVEASKVADELESKLDFWKDCNLTYKEQLGMLKADIKYIIDTLRGESQDKDELCKERKK